MDTLCKAKKLQAMNNYHYYFKITQFLHNIIFDLLIAFTFSTLFCSFPYWFPFLKNLVFDFSFSPKFLFLVVNVIVIFLVGESKLIGSNSSSSSPTSEIYDEYVERSRNFRGLCFQEKTEQSKLEFENLVSTEEKRVKISQDYKQKKEVVKEVIESSIQEQEEEEEEEEEKEEEDFKEVAQEEFQDQELEGDQEEVPDQETEVKEEAKDQENKEIREDEDQESEMPAEELNRRVEEFIARVNKQRWLEEAGLLVCCRA